MATQTDQTILVGLDIGTSKVVVLVGQVQPDQSVQIIGIGKRPSLGMKKGVVVNIESTVQAIERAIEEAELMSGCQIHSVFAGIAGNHIRGMNSRGIVGIRDREVTVVDIERVIDAAQAVAIPADQKVLHILPQEYLIDSQEGIREPLGMSGVRLEANVHLVTCAANSVQNIEKCVRRCGLDVETVILEQLASSYAVLTEDEKELGVCLVDIGGGTTDVAVFTGGSIRFTTVIPIAGDQVTNDIAMALRTPTAHAEEVKRQYGCAMAQLTSGDDVIKVRSVGDRACRSLSRHALADVIEPRFEELFSLIASELHRAGFSEVLATGIVLTGGSSKMHGVVELAEEVFNMPVRLGWPLGVTGLEEVMTDPAYATAVGLLLYGKEQMQSHHHGRTRRENFKGMFRRVKDWMVGNL
jgi:cell division protein FtsA